MKKRILVTTLLAFGYSIFSYGEPTVGDIEMAQDQQPASLEASSLSSDAFNAQQPVPQTQTAQPSGSNAVPGRNVVLNFADFAPPPGSMVLRGVKPDDHVEFTVRSDEIVSKALLNLEYTPSPSLIPVESHLKIYLNDELMGVLPISQDSLGKKSQAQFPIDTRYVTDFNRVKLSLIGHYIQVCENPANSTLWLDVSKASNLDLTYEALPLRNDLANFPEPFFDTRDNRMVTVPMIFAGQPNSTQQRAAGILASWFGAQAKWRGQSFPVLYDTLPTQHGIVFATNEQRPAFLAQYPQVNGPTVEMIGHPDNPYVKLLIVMGRNDEDLITAVTGIAQGNVIFRGQSVIIDKVQQLEPREPYDAPYWIRTDRAMSFSELIEYSGQLQSSGLQPMPISLNLHLPPDLYLSKAAGINMKFKYRYTSPKDDDGSRLSVSLNDIFIQSYPLTTKTKQDSQLVRIPLLQGLVDENSDMTIPILQLGVSNQLRFNFEYSNPIIGGSPERCETYQQIPNHVVIDDASTIDFSGYRHFIAMPDLRAFANAGFPFSRMADLSDTIVFVDQNASPSQIETILNTLGMIGSKVGYAALNVRFTGDWQDVKNADADLLFIGHLPSELTDESKINLLIEETQSWVKMPARQDAVDTKLENIEDAKPESQTNIIANGTMAAIIGFESPFKSKRSVIAILADGPHGYELYNTALNDSGKRAVIYGSTTVIRDSGVNSLRVGELYYVGHIPWWERLWFALATHPVILAVITAISVILAAIVLWRVLRFLSRRRLAPDTSI